MSDLSTCMPSDARFDPFPFDSTLYSHSNSNDVITSNISYNTINTCNYYSGEHMNTIDLSNSDLSILHLNACSLNKHSNNITNYLSILNHHFDVYAFSESWFQYDSDANLIDLDGYSSVNCVRQDRRGGGTSLFIKSDFNYRIRTDLTINCANCDSVFIEISTKAKSIVIGVVYKPEYVVYDDFYFQLSQTLTKISDEKNTCYIMGDFNLDLLKWDSNSNINKFINLFYSHDFFPCIDRPTRIKTNSFGKTSATLIDHIFTNDITKKLNSGILVTDLSDHFPIFTVSKGSRHTNLPQATVKQTRQFKPSNIKGLKMLSP